MFAKRVSVTHSPRGTMAVARRFAKTLPNGSVVALRGPLGSGKTTFIKGMLWGLRGKPVADVRSPTFAILHIYPGRPPVFHYDWFRLERRSELERAGFFDLDTARAITVIEWAVRFASALPRARWEVRFAHVAPAKRRITLSVLSRRSRAG